MKTKTGYLKLCAITLLLFFFASCSSVKKLKTSEQREGRKIETTSKDSLSDKSKDSVTLKTATINTDTRVDSNYETITVIDEDIIQVGDTVKIKRKTVKKEAGNKQTATKETVTAKDSTGVKHNDIISVNTDARIDSTGKESKQVKDKITKPGFIAWFFPLFSIALILFILLYKPKRKTTTA